MTRVLWTTYFVLMVLLALTTGFAYVDTGIAALNTSIALFIAVVKSLLVVLIFMEAKHSSKLTHVIAGAGFFWLGILLTLAMTDYLSRGWLGAGH